MVPPSPPSHWKGWRRASTSTVEDVRRLAGRPRAVAGCTSNGTNTPIGSNPPQGFYFQASPASSGAYFIDVLVPNNMLIAGPLHITGDLTFVLNLFSATAWTSGELGNYLGFTNPSPSTPIGAYLPETQALEPGATGFFVFLSSFGRGVSLPQQGSLT